MSRAVRAPTSTSRMSSSRKPHEATPPDFRDEGRSERFRADGPPPQFRAEAFHPRAHSDDARARRARSGRETWKLEYSRDRESSRCGAHHRRRGAAQFIDRAQDRPGKVLPNRQASAGGAAAVSSECHDRAAGRESASWLRGKEKDRGRTSTCGERLDSLLQFPPRDFPGSTSRRSR